MLTFRKVTLVLLACVCVPPQGMALAGKSRFLPGIFPKGASTPAAGEGAAADHVKTIDASTLMHKKPASAPPLVPTPVIDWKAKPDCVTKDGEEIRYKDSRYDMCIVSEQSWCEREGDRSLARNEPGFRECVEKRDAERVRKRDEKKRWKFETNGERINDALE